MQRKIRFIIHISIKFIHHLRLSVVSISLCFEQGNSLETIRIFSIVLCDLNNRYVNFAFYTFHEFKPNQHVDMSVYF